MPGIVEARMIIIGPDLLNVSRNGYGIIEV